MHMDLRSTMHPRHVVVYIIKVSERTCMKNNFFYDLIFIFLIDLNLYSY